MESKAPFTWSAKGDHDYTAEEVTFRDIALGYKERRVRLSWDEMYDLCVKWLDYNGFMVTRRNAESLMERAGIIGKDEASETEANR